MYTVYALIDPRDNAVRYVGITDDVYARFQQHVNRTRENCRKEQWIQELKAAQVMVIMATLETVPDVLRARLRETYWIHHYLNLGCTLYNAHIPQPFEMLSKRKQEDIAYAIQRVERQELLSSEDAKIKAVQSLLDKGYSMSPILKEVWGVTGGRSYHNAVAEYREIIRMLSNQEIGAVIDMAADEMEA